MSRLVQLDEAIWVAGQIGPGDLADVEAKGIGTILNNRPDGEEWGQPTSAEMEAAARAAGLDYRHIPFQGLPPAPAIEAVRRALAEAEGPVLLFCRSGTRSTWAWALARAREGDDPQVLIDAAANAGYDLGALPLYLG
jgi:uncharacterized protein (TIGR01244 family)